MYKFQASLSNRKYSSTKDENTDQRIIDHRQQEWEQAPNLQLPEQEGTVLRQQWHVLQVVSGMHPRPRHGQELGFPEKLQQQKQQTVGAASQQSFLLQSMADQFTPTSSIFDRSINSEEECNRVVRITGTAVLFLFFSFVSQYFTTSLPTQYADNLFGKFRVPNWIINICRTSSANIYIYIYI